MASFVYISYFGLLIALLATIGGLWALVKQQVVVDSKGHVSEIEIPLFGKLKTNYPSLVAIVAGMGLAAFIVNRVPIALEKVPLSAKISLEGPQHNKLLFVGAIPQRYLQATNLFPEGGVNEIDFQVDSPDSYSVIAFTVHGIDDRGRTIYEVVHGPTEVLDSPRRLEFKGNLASD